MLDREYTSSVTDNDYIFTGKERDDEKTGYDYFGARYLNSRIGRWGGVDVMNDKKPSLNPYQYARLNPIGYVDPNGEDEIKLILRAYIPTSHAGNFMGDNKTSPDINGSYRISHSLTIETNPNINYVPREQFSSGITVGIFPSLKLPYVQFLSSVTVPEYGSYIYRADKYLVVHMWGRASDPLVPGAPPVRYNASFEFELDEEGNIIIATIDGNHTQYPAFEIFVEGENVEGSPQLVYEYPKNEKAESPPYDPWMGPLYLFKSHTMNAIRATIRAQDHIQ